MGLVGLSWVLQKPRLVSKSYLEGAGEFVMLEIFGVWRSQSSMCSFRGQKGMFLSPPSAASRSL